MIACKTNANYNQFHKLIDERAKNSNSDEDSTTEDEEAKCLEEEIRKEELWFEGYLKGTIPQPSSDKTIVINNTYQPDPIPKFTSKTDSKSLIHIISEFQQSHEFWNHQKRSSLQLSQLHKVDSQSTI